MKAPERSKLLELIGMAPERGDPAVAALCKAEYEAFRDWIAAAAKDPGSATAEPGERKPGPAIDVEVVRHARKDRLLSSFVENVWSERMRCLGCHAPGEPPNPKQAENKRRWIADYGGESMLWLGLSPEESLDRLLGGRILDLKNPAGSLILTKPTLQKKHEGGAKMKVGDRVWRQFLRFIEDVAAVRSGAYRRTEDLPSDLPTRRWLRVSGVPTIRFVLMQVDGHRMTDGTPEERPSATALSGAGPKGRWASPLELKADRRTPAWAELNVSRTLPPGRYQLRFYVDADDRLGKDPSHVFGPADLDGMMELDVADWPEAGSDAPKPLEVPALEVAFPAR